MSSIATVHQVSDSSEKEIVKSILENYNVDEIVYHNDVVLAVDCTDGPLHYSLDGHSLKTLESIGIHLLCNVVVTHNWIFFLAQQGIVYAVEMRTFEDACKVLDEVDKLDAQILQTLDTLVQDKEVQLALQDVINMQTSFDGSSIVVFTRGFVLQVKESEEKHDLTVTTIYKEEKSKIEALSSGPMGTIVVTEDSIKAVGTYVNCYSETCTNATVTDVKCWDSIYGHVQDVVAFDTHVAFLTECGKVIISGSSKLYKSEEHDTVRRILPIEEEVLHIMAYPRSKCLHVYTASTLFIIGPNNISESEWIEFDKFDHWIVSRFTTTIHGDEYGLFERKIDTCVDQLYEREYKRRDKQRRIDQRNIQMCEQLYSRLEDVMHKLKH